MSAITDASQLTSREETAINNIESALGIDADPGAWADCGEVDAPVLISAVKRLQRELRLSQEKNQKLVVERDGTLLYSAAKQDRIADILKLAMSPLPSYEEMVKQVGQSTKPWIPVTERLPEKQDYYDVKFTDGSEDEKFYRIRGELRGFLSEEEITHWR